MSGYVSSPVSMPPPVNYSNGPDTLVTIQPGARDFADSPTDAPTVTIAGFPAVLAATNARLRIDVPPGCMAVQFRAIGNLPDQILPISVYVDGAWNQAMFVPIGETTLRVLGIALNGAHHVVELWLSFLQLATQGALIYDVRGVGIRVLAPVSVTRRIVVYGDSISCGGLANPNSELGWVPRMRLATSIAFAHEGWSGRRLWDDSGSGGGQLGFASHSALVDRFANLLTGATTGDVYLAIGINDNIMGAYTAPQFQTSYSDLLDVIHTRLPAARIYCQTMLTTTTHEDTTPAFRTAINNAATGRSYCTVIDGTTLCSSFQDGLHPDNTGHGQIATALQGIL